MTASVNSAILSADGVNDIKILNLYLNGNMGAISEIGILLIRVFSSSNVLIQNNTMYNNAPTEAIKLSNSNYVTINNNIIYETDCGIITQGAASSHLIITQNTIYGINYKKSEPISIYNTDVAIAEDIFDGTNWIEVCRVI